MEARGQEEVEGVKKTSWHKRKEDQVSAPLLLYPTQGQMTKEMKEVFMKFEEVTGWRIPVVERAGILFRSIAKADPLKMEGCKRLDHFPCTSGGGNCEKNRSGYQIRCKNCHQDGIPSFYEGENGRNA